MAPQVDAIGSISLGVDVLALVIPLYTTDVIVSLPVTDADDLSVFCELGPPDPDDVVSFVCMSDDDVTAAMVLCCEC